MSNVWNETSQQRSHSSSTPHTLSSMDNSHYPPGEPGPAPQTSSEPPQSLAGERSQDAAANDENQQPRAANAATIAVPPEVSSDANSNIRYVLFGQPTGWSAMAQVVRAYDEDKVKDTKEDIDTLMVFVSTKSYVQYFYN